MRIFTARLGSRSAAVALALALSVAFNLGGCGASKNTGSDAAATAQDGSLDAGLTDDTAAPDALPDTKVTDGSSDGSQPGDADAEAGGVDIVSSCPGGANCPCKVSADCDNNICLEVADGHRCAIDCGGGACPGGFACSLIAPSGGDAQYVCVPNWGRICEPCDNSKLCSAALGNEKGVCIAYGGLEGSFCGSQCALDADCPGGYGCKDVTSIEGKAAKQCARLPDDVGHIQCPCDGNAAAQKLSTTCNAAVVTGGSCPGTRTCGSAGLGACTASPAAGEICDGIDNDCNGLTDDVVCDDKNLCTEDACQPADQTCTHTPNTLVCTDGNACTSGDICSSGTCTGKPIACDDQNACTSDSCDAKLGCQYENAAIPCDDADACTLGDACVDGGCVSGKKKDCDDKNACTTDGCSKLSGLCGHADLTGNACTDGDFCTSDDACATGKCVGTPVNCDDNNTCTSDGCNMASGCTQTALATGCDDGNPCTVGDKCVDSVCISGSQKACNDQNACTSDSCDTSTGNCVNKPLNGAACNDGNACTEPDACTDTACTGKTKNCDDSNSCTSDSCDPASGCTHTGLSGGCSDGNGCTIGDTCTNNFCISGTAKNCDDNNPCTGDSCDQVSGDCVHTPLPGQSCNDGNACTGPDICGGGSAGPTGCAGPGKSCDDSNLCTDDSCDTTSGCTHTGNAKPCDDGNACTTSDTCVTLFTISGCQGTAINAATVCDDSNPCTTDTCTPASGCTYTPKVNAACDDYNPCTQNDTCNANGLCISGQNICGCNADGDCVQSTNLCSGTLYCDKAAAPYFCKIKAGTVVTCDTSLDGACKTTSCEPATGKCIANAKPDTLACDADGSVCTPGDACLGGFCKAGTALNCDDSNPCTVDSCDAAAGCKHSYNAIACTDGNACTLNDVCAGGSCQPGSLKACVDGVYCTTDSCDPASGNCVFDGAYWEGKDCDDGSKCTVGDKCGSGACVPGSALNCEDGNPCTDNSCDASNGCVSANNSATCSDLNACTAGDVCQSGSCTPGTTVTNCNDSNTCTVDNCNTSTGACVNAPTNEGGGCNADNSVCTILDTCKAGTCVADAPRTDCVDSNVCTDDACDPAKACVFTNNTVACSDGDACTANDLCQNGACKSGATVNCNDNKACTADACDGVGGCSHTALDQVTATACIANADACTGGNCWCVVGTCKNKGCGDGVLDASNNEQCDDGNATGCDGCESCVTRSAVVFAGAGSGTSGFGAPSIATPYLGIDGDMTVEAWIKPSNFSDVQPIVTYSGPFAQVVQTYYLALETTTGKLFFQHAPSLALGAESVKSTTAVTANVWTHVAAVVAGQNVRLYINGALAGSGVLLNKRQNSLSATLAIGRVTPDVYTKGFNGAIDEVHIAAAPLYGAAFTPARRVVMTAATRGLWHLDEATGTTSADASGNGTQKPAYNLTLTGATWLADACYGAAKNAGVCGDGQVASGGAGVPALEECEPTSSTGCGVCQDCRYRKELTLGGSSAVVTPAFSSWAADAFCPTCEVTIEMWAKLDVYSADGAATLLSTTCSAGASQPPCNGLSILLFPDYTISLIRNGATALGQGYVPTKQVLNGEWHHYAIEMGWANFAPTRLYIDGTLALDIKPSQWDPGTPTATPSAFLSETLMIGGTPMDHTGNPVVSLVDSGDTPAQLTSVADWQGQFDEVRVSAGFRYGNNFVPARRGFPDASTRALWHMDGATATLLDDSGQGVATVNSSPTVADDCYAAQANSAMCGDGNLAPWEWDDGSSKKAGNFPASTVATAGLMCTPYWLPDCTGFSWTSSDTNAPALTNAVLNYPSLATPSATVAGPWTWEGWVRLPALPASGKIGTIVAMDSSQSGGACGQSQSQAWAIQTNSDGTDASTIGPGTASVTKQVWKAGVWQHFALEYHGDATGSLWVDGQKARTFTVTGTAWSGSCKMHVGSREGGVNQTNRISGALASLHLTSQVKYGAPFDPPWTLPRDSASTVTTASTLFYWDFKTNALCTTGNLTDMCSQAVDKAGATITNAYIDLGGGSGSVLLSGPSCASQPSP